MLSQKLKRVVSFGLLSALVILSSATVAFAATPQSSSTNYRVNEVFFGTGGELNACSTSYCSKQSAGELAAGNTSSTNYQAQGGFNTDRVPSLTFIASSSSTNLGTLSTGSTATGTSTFSVKSYLTDGYVVINASDPPKNGTHALSNLTSPTASNSSAEQFGINLVANTSPATFGANPVQVPSGSYSYGTVAAGYNTADLYKYVKGDTIASSNKSTGETDYTISYIFNITSTTPGGTYTFDHVLVATSTF